MSQDKNLNRRVSSQDRTGTAFVLCAPSGTGKTTLVRMLVEKFKRFAFSISCTTRAPRAHEQDGVDYYFLDKSEFEKRIDQKYFAEWARVHGNYYGTPLGKTIEILQSGRDILFDIDVQGAAQLKRNLPGTFLVFIMPPSRAELEKRLRSRGTDDEASINIRLQNAKSELREAGWFDAWLMNDDIDQAFKNLCSLYYASSLIPQRRGAFLDDLLSQF